MKQLLLKQNLFRFFHFIFFSLSLLATVIIFGMICFVLGFLIYHGAPHLTLSFLTEAPSNGMRKGGIFPCIIGTFFLVSIMIVVVMPIGILTALYLNEYAPKDSKFVRLVRMSIQNLAGVPAIVYGLFGLGFFVYFVGGTIDRLFYDELYWGKPAIIWSALTLALLSLPTVVVTSEEAFRRVPNFFREAGYAMGMTQWQVIRHTVMPQSMSGILTGGILALARGAGEVAPVILTGAAYFLPELPTSLSDQFMELGYHIFAMATQSPNVTETLPTTYATALVLLLLTFSLGITSILFRARIRRRQKY